MRRSRKGYALNEILLLISLFVLIMAFHSRLFFQLMKEIPVMIRVSETQTSTEAMLQTLRQDVEHARRIHLSPPPEKQMTLEGPNGRIAYSFCGEQMRREPQDPNQSASSVWSLPNVQMEWSIVSENGLPAALEIHTRQMRTALGRRHLYFRQVHLFFAGLQLERCRQ